MDFRATVVRMQAAVGGALQRRQQGLGLRLLLLQVQVQVLLQVQVLGRLLLEAQFWHSGPSFGVWAEAHLQLLGAVFFLEE